MLLALFVFLSGNSQPPGSFVSGADLGTFLDLKEFRGALALDRVELDSDGPRPIQLRFAGLSRIGYTPIPVPPRLRLSSRRYGLGEELQRDEIEEGWRGGLLADRSGAYLTNTMQFRIGEPSRTIGRVITGLEAPFVTMSLRYEIRLNGIATVAWRGSSIPSIDYYWESAKRIPNFRLNRQHNMVELTESGWSRFLAAGADVPPVAPLDEVWGGTIP